jgi:hypothetical protein
MKGFYLTLRLIFKTLNTMKKLFYITIITAVFAAFSSCGKYEEGPAVSFRSKKARMVNVWKESEYVDPNGTVTVITNPGTMELTKDGQVFFNGSSLGTTWDFSDGKEELVLTTTAFSITTSTKYPILRLKNEELWIKDPTDGSQAHYVSN